MNGALWMISEHQIGDQKSTPLDLLYFITSIDFINYLFSVSITNPLQINHFTISFSVSNKNLIKNFLN